MIFKCISTNITPTFTCNKKKKDYLGIISQNVKIVFSLLCHIKLFLEYNQCITNDLEYKFPFTLPCIVYIIMY